MTTYARPRRAAKPRYPTPQKLEALREWIDKPFTPVAECVAAAVGGAVMFFLFVFVGLMA